MYFDIRELENIYIETRKDKDDEEYVYWYLIVSFKSGTSKEICLDFAPTDKEEFSQTMLHSVYDNILETNNFLEKILVKYLEQKTGN